MLVTAATILGDIATYAASQHQWCAHLLAFTITIDYVNDFPSK